MCDSAALNPDPVADGAFPLLFFIIFFPPRVSSLRAPPGDGVDDELFCDVDEVAAGAAGEQALSRLDALLVDDTGRFDDACDDEECEEMGEEEEAGNGHGRAADAVR